MPQYIEFVSNHPFLFIALFAVLVLIVKAEIDNRLSGVPQTGAMEAVRLMDDDSMLILDVREASEYHAGHLAHALHIPLSALKSRIAELDKYKTKTVLAYCRSGARSNTACRQLKKAGFEKPYNLAGGVIGWGNANLPLTKK